MSIKKILAVSALGLLLAGCKIEIMVPEGGRVTTLSGEHSCEGGEVCEVFVNDIHFDQTFVAEPGEGMQFDSWQKRDRGFCGGGTKNCRLFTSAFEGFPLMMAFLENDEQVFHLSPVFSKIDNSATPIACEFLQTPPVGDFSFEVCVVADVLNETVCESIAGVTWGTESKITERDCAGDSPSGYCETPIGDIYYYTDEDFSTGCTFMNGVWHEL